MFLTMSSLIFLWPKLCSFELLFWILIIFYLIFVCSSFAFSCENTIETSSLVGFFDIFTSILRWSFLSYSGFLSRFILTIEFSFLSNMAKSSGLSVVYIVSYSTFFLFGSDFKYSKLLFPIFLC